MKHKMKLLSLALCAAMLLSVPALAAETPPAPDADSVQITAMAPVAPVHFWGQVTKQEDGSLLLQNAEEGASNPEVIVRLPEGTPCVDASSGEPLDMGTVKDGDTLYVWAGPAMTMSLPPQTNAVVVVGNVPADGEAPQYAEITAPVKAPASDSDTERRFPIAGGELVIPESAEVKPFQTKNIVKLDSLVPGTQVMTWTGSDGKVSRVVVFPYGYSGYLTADESGEVRMNGELLAVKGRVIQSEDLTQLYLPLRAAAETAGYEVDWVSGKGAVVSEYGTELFSVKPGSDTAQTAGDEYSLLGGCIVDNGVTYLPAGDMAALLHLYFYTA